MLLGCFWGISPSLYKLMGAAGIPVSHVIVYTGFGVGIALWVAGSLISPTFKLSRAIVLFGLGCGAIMNIPFGLSLYFARHVPPAEYSLIVSTAPFFNYVLALLTGRENATLHRLLAVTAGFVSSAVLILSRQGMGSGENHAMWIALAFLVPIVYSLYNWFAARFWPQSANIFAVGTAESLFSGLVAVPVLLALEPPWTFTYGLQGYVLIAGATIMWVVERLTFFVLIRDRGAVYTIQAVYVATPAGVLFALAIFGGSGDLWLWVSLGLLMIALWLNNFRQLPGRSVATP